MCAGDANLRGSGANFLPSIEIHSSYVRQAKNKIKWGAKVVDDFCSPKLSANPPELRANSPTS